MNKVIYLYKGGSNMKREISIFDVANTFLTYEEMTHKKLQKLCYYAQSWNLALYKERLFNYKFQAWVHGPVCKELYDKYKPYGWQSIPQVSDVPGNINEDEMELIDTVYNTYGEFDGDQLELLTHSEQPWIQARKGLEEWVPTDRPIDEKIIIEYYSESYERSQND